MPVGQECGMAFQNYEDMRVGDVIECFRVEMVTRRLKGLARQTTMEMAAESRRLVDFYETCDAVPSRMRTISR